MIPTITLWKSSSPFSLKGNALGECWLVSSRCVAAVQMVFDTLFDKWSDELFDTLFDMGFDLTVWFGGRDGCVRTEARVEVRRRRERASGWKRREEKEAEKQLRREALLEEKRRGPHGLRFRRGNDAGGEGERERRREKGGEQRVDLLQLLLFVLQTQNHVH